MTEVVIRGEKLTLLPEKVIHWQRTSSLFIADLHLGKTSHFRKEGVGIPDSLIHEDYKKLYDVLRKYPAKNIFLLGDLFHSEHNSEWTFVKELIQSHLNKTFHLIMGNHDILDFSHYEKAGLVIHKEELFLPPFRLTHEPPEMVSDEHYILCGHIHPGVSIRGKGRQYFRLPCFYFSKDYAILPAFGTFTGLKTIKRSEEDCAYAILNNSVIQLKESSFQNH